MLVRSVVSEGFGMQNTKVMKRLPKIYIYFSDAHFCFTLYSTVENWCFFFFFFFYTRSMLGILAPGHDIMPLLHLCVIVA